LHQPLGALVALLPIFVFAVLDAQYLRIELRFRGLFELIRAGERHWLNMRLSTITAWAGHKDIGTWIDNAAQQAGR
jgi:hypothetical protein